MKKFYLLLTLSGLCMATLHAQTNPTAQSLPYAENFGSTAHTATTYPAGWQGWTVATAPGSTYNTSAPTADRTLTASSSASVNSGNVHNYNGKIGFLNTGSLDLALVLAVNTTGLSNVQVTYDIMTLRNPYDTTTNTRINEVTLQYRVGTTGTFTTLTGMEYQNNTLTQIGSGVTTPQNAQTKNVSLPSACNNQSVVQLRWISRQVSGGGARPSFAVDNITVAVAGGKNFSMGTTTNATEGSSPVVGTYSLNFNPATTTGTSFNYNITGTATFNTDYTVTLSGGATPATLTSATGIITVPASSSTITATVTPINDALSEGVETVIMKVSSVSDSYVIGDSTETMNILDDEATKIHSIQGSGMTAIAGAFTVEGIVTGIYPTLSPAGFYMQEEDADADTDPTTSEGIFVVSNATVAVGDKIRVSGNVQEDAAAPSYQQAVINTPSVSVLSSGNPTPTIINITLPVTAINDFEKYECMLVKFTDTLTVTDNYNLGRYGEINLSQGGMTYQPTQIVDPNDVTASGTTASGALNVSAVDAYALSNAVRTILMDDGRGVIPTLPFVNADNTLRLGSTIKDATGIMGYAFSKYRIQPIPAAAPVFNYAARPTLPLVGTGYNVRVASFNVLNYFNGDGTGGGFPTARGAHSAAEFTRQRNKIINAIAEINADVVGLIEIENDGTGANSAIQDLVNGLNTKMGANTYSIINDGATQQSFGTDAIRCGIIYKSSVLTPVNAVMLSSNTVFNRPPVAQTFSLSNGEKFNYIINHFKSKSCSGSTGADVDMLDGQSCYNYTRRMQAGELVNFINTTIIPTSGSHNILSMGDYNAYFEEDPLDSLRAKGFTVLGTGTGYSYLFSGLVGSLDNAVVSDSLLSKVTGIAKWALNSAEPTHLDYNDDINDGSGDFVNQWGATYSTIPFRSSDHDPVIVGLNLSTPPPIHIGDVAQNNFRIYPNPANETVYIEMAAVQTVRVQLMNSIGQTVLENELVQQKNSISLSGLASGIYLLHITDAAGNVQTKRLVKQ